MSEMKGLVPIATILLGAIMMLSASLSIIIQDNVEIISIPKIKDSMQEDPVLYTREDKNKNAFGFSFNDPKIIPSVPQYNLPLNLTDIGSLDVLENHFELNQSQKDFLSKNGFVGIIDNEYTDFTSAYQDLVGFPTFITTDSMLHSYHVFFDDTLKVIEKGLLYELCKNMTRGLLEKSMEQYTNAQGEFTFISTYEVSTYGRGNTTYSFTETINLKEAARKNVAYFSVALKLIDPNTSVPVYVVDLVQEELDLIDAQAGFANSPIFDKSYVDPGILLYVEDYSQYKPRGHYTRSEILKRYFKTMMWYGRMTYRIKSGEELIQAIMISDAVKTACYDDIPISEIWHRIYDITAFFVGTSDDLTFEDYSFVSGNIYPELSHNYSELINSNKLLEYQKLLRELRAPRICSMWVKVNREDIVSASFGFRVMGQRFIPDSYMFQELVFPKVDIYRGTGAPFTLSATGGGQAVRGVPRGLDVMGILGSEIAEDFLLRDGDTEYMGFPQQYYKLQNEFQELNQSAWTQNLYWGWLRTLESLNDNFSTEEYPTFMRNRAWQAEKLNTNLGSWAELRHDTILYGKQSYTGDTDGGGPALQEGYVEPIPLLYSRLVDLTNATIDGLNDLSVLPEKRMYELRQFRDLLLDYQNIAIKELRNQELSRDDYYVIQNIGDTLHDIMVDIDSKGQETRVIADVHTDTPSKQCLEEGVGYVNFIIVIVKRPDGSLDALVGPTFSYFEFRWPMGDRLTDEKWQEILDKNENVPSQFNWMDYPPDMGSISNINVDVGININDIVLSNHTPTEGDILDIHVEVKNFGKENVSMSLEIHDGDPIYQDLISSVTKVIPVHNSSVIRIEWNTTNEKLGEHVIYFSITETSPTDEFPLNNRGEVSLSILLRDSDGDGVGDDLDEFPSNPDEWADTDEDGYGDNSDAFPLDPKEWLDSDNDSYGDNSDIFPDDPKEWFDTDNDGYGDNSDIFPNDPKEWLDTDDDGYGDNSDVFPNDPKEWLDTDGDGYGDNSDAFPDDAKEWLDSDDDGIGDNSDAFPDNPKEWSDTDDDGIGDNSDAFPYDSYEWDDTDKDGIGDNSDYDIDGDGWNNTIEMEIGTDIYDNQSFPPDMDLDGIPDSLDSDRDGDGVPNLNDAYPDDGDRWGRPKIVEEGNSAVWWLVIVAVVMLVLGLVVGVVLFTKRGRRRKRIGEEEMKDGAVDEIGRVGRDGGGEEVGDG